MNADIFSLFEANTKNEVKRLCSNLELSFDDIRYLVKLSEAKVIEFPYLHACKLYEHVPESLKLTKKNIDAFTSNGVGKLSPQAKKTVNIIFEMPKQIKRSTAHLFYHPDHQFWHLFYFDIRDRDVDSNHWEYGTHLHYVSWVWPNLECRSVWKSFCESGKKGIGGDLHIRFKR